MSDSGQTGVISEKQNPQPVPGGLERHESEAAPDIVLKIAKERADLGDVAGAANILANAIVRHPGNVALIQRCARYHVKMGQMATVIELLTPIEADANANVALMLAKARSKECGAAEAAFTLKGALERHRGNVDLVAQCAKYLLEANDPSGAAAMLMPFEDELAAGRILLLAGAMSDAGDAARSEAIVVRALERLPDDPALLGHLAEMHLRNGRPRDAVALLSKIEDVARPPRLLVLAQGRLRSGDPAGALATLQRGAERFPDSAILLQALATASSMAGDTKGALALLDRVPEPRAVAWFAARAKFFETLGDVPGFEAAIRDGLNAFPDDLSLLSLLSRCLASQGKLDEAAQVGTAIENIVVVNPKSLGDVVTSNFVLGGSQGAGELISRLVSKLEDAKLSRASVQGLTELISGARILLPEIGLPILRRILAKLNDPAVRLNIGQQILVATACGAVGDNASLRRHVEELTPKAETLRLIIEAMSLAAWTDDTEALAVLAEPFRSAAARELRVTGASSTVQLDPAAVRFFSDRELGVLGFGIGGQDVAFVFNGLYDFPSVTQQKIVLGLLSRGTDVVRMLDMRRDVHLSGIGPLARDRAESIGALKRFLGERGYRRSICIGLSGGGMPAAIYGDAIGAERVVVFSTGTFFPPDDDPVERRARAFLDKVRKPGLDVGTDNLEIWRRPGPHPKFEIHFPAANPQDSRQALRMKGVPGVVLHPVNTARHGFASTLSTDELADAILGTADAAPGDAAVS